MGDQIRIRKKIKGIPRLQTNWEGAHRVRGKRGFKSVSSGFGRDNVPPWLFNGWDIGGGWLPKLWGHARIQTQYAVYGADAESDAPRDHLQMETTASIRRITNENWRCQKSRHPQGLIEWWDNHCLVCLSLINSDSTSILICFSYCNSRSVYANLSLVD